MITQLREGPIVWTPDIVAANAVTAFPSGPTAGVAPVPTTQRAGSRIHVLANFSVASGTMGLGLSLYGYASALALWVYLAQLNGGAQITADTTRWSESATAIKVAETFIASAENYSRYATRIISLSGTTPSVSTYIGITQD